MRRHFLFALFKIFAETQKTYKTTRSEKMVLTQVSVVSLAVTAVYAVVAFIFAFTTGRSQTRINKLILAWLLFDALIHFTLVRFVRIS